ncbi:hypothetical protein [Jiella sonneratiae]|uniref:Uncharacterized protein n=1 Tax=Jiella sonneratiae TaxID=2816856 RepID=A0ABS3J2S5_9HYPH|nr:hypothetical protein [Jiella sonneratiae]MBO0903960.1 hypothetical protein [Jiella sonneratiae]
MKLKIITATALLAAATAAHAGDLKPEAGQTIRLGTVQGAAYYTVEGSGLRLVATLADGESGTPLRFVSTLSDGETTTIAVPGTGGAEPATLTFRRIGDRVAVESGADLRAALTD